MITNIILSVLLVFLEVILTPITALPDVSFSNDLLTAWANFLGYMHTIDLFFPITTLLEVFGILVIAEVAIFGYKLIMWLLKKIPGIS